MFNRIDWESFGVSNMRYWLMRHIILICDWLVVNLIVVKNRVKATISSGIRRLSSIYKSGFSFISVLLTNSQMIEFLLNSRLPIISKLRCICLRKKYNIMVIASWSDEDGRWTMEMTAFEGLFLKSLMGFRAYLGA